MLTSTSTSTLVCKTLIHKDKPGRFFAPLFGAHHKTHNQYATPFLQRSGLAIRLCTSVAACLHVYATSIRRFWTPKKAPWLVASCILVLTAGHTCVGIARGDTTQPTVSFFVPFACAFAAGFVRSHWTHAAAMK
jgi:hypothetical protein